MGKKKKRRGGGKSITQTAFKFIRLGALVAPAASRLMGTDPMDYKLTDIIIDYTGFNIKHSSWHPDRLMTGWGPYLMACVTTYGIPKLAGILRRL